MELEAPEKRIRDQQVLISKGLTDKNSSNMKQDLGPSDFALGKRKETKLQKVSLNKNHNNVFQNYYCNKFGKHKIYLMLFC